MINTLEIRNFKGFSAANLSLGQLTGIVGPNASGKSSILEALHYLTQLGSTEPRELLTEERDPYYLYHRGGDGYEDMILSCTNSLEATVSE